MAGRSFRFSSSSLVRAGLLTGVIDGLFSSILSVAAYGSTVTRLFQGVASVLMGPAALNGGTSTAALGVLMRPPTINARWWIQFVGHFPFVGLPIVWSIGRMSIRPIPVSSNP